jgi:ribosomal protection tetracycline resistance protein
MRTLNLGILAHVDAGKTSLTERMLHASGVIDEPGSVDAGTSHTDVLDLERRRGITIKAAVVSFVVGDVTVNLIDTPGHPDFIAEVERALGVLDGAVLVISAVEGVQAQTRILMRALQRLRVPTLLFVNKIDRAGAQEDSLLGTIADRLTPALVPMGTTRALGTRAAEFMPFDPAGLDVTAVADHDERVLAGLVGERPLPGPGEVRRALSTQSRRANVHPVYFGSAMTGAGIGAILAGITSMLPAGRGDPDGPLAGTVFKIARGPAGDRVAYVRMLGGTLRVRDRVGEHTVTSVEVFDRGTTVRRSSAVDGEIALVRGLGHVRIGDTIGAPRRRRPRPGRPGDRRRDDGHHFAPPTLETLVVPEPRHRRRELHAALTELTDQDPLIGLRLDDVRQELHLSLYGEVQKEVIQATLAEEYGLSVEFRETLPICIERPVGTGGAVEHMHDRSAEHPFLAGIGLRVDPAPAGSGVTFRYEIELGSLPAAFLRAIAETVPEALRQGLHGWEVSDCVVTLTHSDYAPRQSHAHQGFSKAMSSVGSDFRLLTPLVLMAALRRARTVVCEPVHRYELEIPVAALPAMVPALARLGAPPREQSAEGTAVVLAGRIRAARVHALQTQIPELTRGEGVLESTFDGYEPVRGRPPSRARTDSNPLDRDEYLRETLGAARAGPAG